MTIKYQIRHVYGVPKRYPVEKAAIKALYVLNGHTTLTDDDVEGLKLLGHDLVEVFVGESGEVVEKK